MSKPTILKPATSNLKLSHLQLGTIFSLPNKSNPAKRYIPCENSVKNLLLLYFFFFCWIVACGKCIYVFGGYNGLERKHHGEVYSLSTGAVSYIFFPSVQSRNLSKWVICPTWPFKSGHFKNGLGQTMTKNLKNWHN